MKKIIFILSLSITISLQAASQAEENYRVLEKNRQELFELLLTHIHENNIEEFKKLTLERPEAFFISRNQSTLLHEALKSGTPELCTLIIDQTSDVNSSDKEGLTPLHYAAYRRDRALVKALLKKNADPNARDQKLRVPLHLVVQEPLDFFNNIELLSVDTLFVGRSAVEDIIELLCKRGADSNARDISGRTPLHDASAGTNSNAAYRLIENQADLHAQDDEGKMALHKAVTLGLSGIDMVEVLLSKGARVNARDKNGETPLHLAISRGCRDLIAVVYEQTLQRRVLYGSADCVEVVALLIDHSHSAVINLQDDSGEAALHKAVALGHSGLKIVELLLKKGANINIKNRLTGTTPLHDACYNNYMGLAMVLLEHDALVNIPDFDGHAPLHSALCTGQSGIDLIEHLLIHGADSNYRDRWGNSPLHTASNHPQTEIVQELLLFGADIKAKNSKGRVALHQASNALSCQIVPLLIHKELLSLPDDENNTALHYVIKPYSGNRRNATKQLDCCVILLSAGADYLPILKKNLGIDPAISLKDILSNAGWENKICKILVNEQNISNSSFPNSDLSITFNPSVHSYLNDSTVQAILTTSLLLIFTYILYKLKRVLPIASHFSQRRPDTNQYGILPLAPRYDRVQDSREHLNETHHYNKANSDRDSHFEYQQYITHEEAQELLSDNSHQYAARSGEQASQTSISEWGEYD